VSQTLRDQQKKLEEDLRRQITTPVTPQTLSDPDSLKRLGEQIRKIDTDSLQKIGRDLLKGFFGKPKPAPSRRRPRPSRPVGDGAGRPAEERDGRGEVPRV